MPKNVSFVRFSSSKSLLAFAELLKNPKEVLKSESHQRRPIVDLRQSGLPRKKSEVAAAQTDPDQDRRIRKSSVGLESSADQVLVNAVDVLETKQIK
jgi:hypothetical protein